MVRRHAFITSQAILLLLIAPSVAAETHAQGALSAALRGTSAIGLVIDATRGQPLAAMGDVNKQSAPGVHSQAALS